tara:strand:+ start:121 stop:444 length:324 start_codon:yes stop_codon:yes gene_type:complete
VEHLKRVHQIQLTRVVAEVELQQQVQTQEILQVQEELGVLEQQQVLQQVQWLMPVVAVAVEMFRVVEAEVLAVLVVEVMVMALLLKQGIMGQITLVVVEVVEVVLLQ